MKNQGDADAEGKFCTKLYVDGVEKCSWPKDGFGAGKYTHFSKNIGTLSEGEHTVKVETDTSKTIVESYELINNKHSSSLTVSSSSICFIATVAYGTPLHEDINVLRDFRDEYLMTNPAGRTSVNIYYTASPPIADVISGNEGLRIIVREGMVKPLVYITRIFVR